MVTMIGENVKTIIKNVFFEKTKEEEEDDGGEISGRRSDSEGSEKKMRDVG